MKLAVFHNLPFGGAKRALHGLVKSLGRLGCAVDVFVPCDEHEGTLPLEGVARNVERVAVQRTAVGLLVSSVRYLPPVGGFTAPLADLEDAHRRIAARIDSRGYDAVFVEQDRHTLAPFVLRYLETPNAYYCQQPFGWDERVTDEIERVALGNRGPVSWMRTVARRYTIGTRSRIDRANAACARVILANSNFSREAIRRAYGAEAWLSRLGVDVGVFSPGSGRRNDYVLSVGYLGPRKGYDFLIRALATIASRIRPPLIVVANAAAPGWGRYLQELAARLDVALEIRVAIPDKELVSLYRSAKLFVYASHVEPFGLAPLEAMACGTPVVAIAEGGIEESIPGGDGGVLARRDEHVFAEEVTRLLGDAVARRRMGERAVEWVLDRWTIEHAGRTMLGHLERVVTGALPRALFGDRSGVARPG